MSPDPTATAALRDVLGERIADLSYLGKQLSPGHAYAVADVVLRELRHGRTEMTKFNTYDGWTDDLHLVLDGGAIDQDALDDAADRLRDALDGE